MIDRAKATAGLLSLVALGVLGLGAALAGRLQGVGRVEAPSVLWDAPEFALTDQAGGTLSRTDLLGTVWLASFVYTNCPDFCPLVTRRMAEIRDDLAADGVLGSHVRLVSITVDPARDTPAVLREYAAGFGADDPARWAFLTGEPERVRAVVEAGFKLPATPASDPHAAPMDVHGDGPTHGATSQARGPKDAAAGDPAAAGEEAYAVLHSDRIVLVDAAGRVRGLYSATDPAEQARLDSELRMLLQDPGANRPGAPRR
ncbi:MAG TPA: SCO family protein [Longimicrobiales bacterium]